MKKYLKNNNQNYRKLKNNNNNYFYNKIKIMKKQ